MTCANCHSSIEQERISILPNTKVCSSCAQQYIKLKPKKGIMIYGHKTAGEMQVVSVENFRDYRRLNPYGRHTGRGSGIHRVSKATEYM
jgi:hypothetical protein